jgi:AAHS family 4-hydroxybenzoate transporter-like MFS transporter
LKAEQKAIDVEAFIDSHAISSFQIGVLILCGCVLFLDGFNTQVIAYLAPIIAKAWNLPKSALSWIFSSGLAGLMAGFLLLAPLADRLGRRPVMVACTGLFGLFTILSTWANSSETLILFRFLTGVGLGGAMPNAFALTGEYCPRRWRATLVVVMSSGLTLGSIAAGLLSASLVSSIGWRGILWLGGVAPLAIAVVLQIFLPESLNFLVLKDRGRTSIARVLRAIDRNSGVTDETEFFSSEPRIRGASVVQLLGDGRLVGTVLLWVLFFANLLVLYFIQNWLPTILNDAGVALKKAIQITTLAMAGGIVAALVTGPLMDRLGPYIILTGLFLGGAASVAMVGLTPTSSLTALSAATFCAGFFVAGAQKSANALAVVFYPSAIRSSGVGWALGIGRVGSIAGPIAAGILISLGWSHAKLFYAAAAPLLVGAGAALAMEQLYGRRRVRRVTG